MIKKIELFVRVNRTDLYLNVWNKFEVCSQSRSSLRKKSFVKLTNFAESYPETRFGIAYVLSGSVQTSFAASGYTYI